MKKYALTTDEGTAIAESCLCEKHNIKNCRDYVTQVVRPNDAIDKIYVDVSNNDECKCIICPN